MAKEIYRSGKFDTILGESSVRLFGRLMWDIVLRKYKDRKTAYKKSYPGSPVPPRLSNNDFLLEQLTDKKARLARISSFSYQNEIFDLAKPAIFLVHGAGTVVEFEKDTSETGQTLRKSPPYIERSGVVGQSGSFAPEILMWVYDRADFTIRLDSETGTFSQLLLDHELGHSPQTGSMQSGLTDPPSPPSRRRRWRWRGNGED